MLSKKDKPRYDKRRFTEVHWEKGDHSVQNFSVLMDKETGVQYLFSTWGYAGGLTVLVDENGKPLIDKHFQSTQED